MISEKKYVHWFTLLLFGVMLIAAENAWAACNIFVALDGDDSNLGTDLSPFRTIQRGADAALTPGDTVCVRPGVYFENNQDAPSTAFKGVKVRAGGSPGNPIIFQADPNVIGNVIIDMQFDVSIAPGAALNPVDALGFYIRAFDHITIRGFEIRNVTTGILTQAINSPNAVTPGPFDPPSNIIIENNHIHDVRRSQLDPNFDSNIAPVRPNDCYDCVIRGNRLHGVTQINGSGTEIFTNQNSAGVHSFGMLRTIIENNEIFDAHTGIFQKSWTNQPLVGDPLYDAGNVPPPINKAADFGVKIRRNLIHDTVLGVRLSPSGGSGRIISGSGNAHGNPAHYNAEISENIFYSTDSGVQRLGSDFARMEWALQTDLRGTVEQSERLKFFNNTVITHNGVNVDAVSEVQIYNNFFSLSVTTGAISGPEIAIQTTYSRVRATQHLAGGGTLNLGTPAAPVPIVAAGNCLPGPDPDLTDNGGTSPVSTPPFSPGDAGFFCDDNIQWTAEITLSDFNYYHVGKNFRLNRFGAGGNGVQAAGVEQLQSSLAAWQALADQTLPAGVSNFGLSDNNPDQNSLADLAPAPGFLAGVTINPSAGVTIDPTHPTPFLHPPALDNAGRVGGLLAGAPVSIGAFPNGVYDPNSGPFDPATDSGFIGTPRFVAAPGGMNVE